MLRDHSKDTSRQGAQVELRNFIGYLQQCLQRINVYFVSILVLLYRISSFFHLILFSYFIDFVSFRYNLFSYFTDFVVSFRWISFSYFTDFRFISLDFVFLLYRFRFISLDFVFLLYRFRWILFSFRFVSQFTGTHLCVISQREQVTFDEMIMISVMYQSNTLNWIFIVIVRHTTFRG